MRAVITGYKAARHEWFANMDSDGATDPSEFERLAPYLKDVGLVTGSRVLRGDRPPVEKSLMRQILSKGLSTLFAALFRCGVRDPQIGCRIFRREALMAARCRC
ncbi:MAG: glycosyltransferase [candidate division Zixibacteria bacterium]|nr:glycosyltransferase [candidate division Zixibacteria bacterium]